MPSTQLRSGEEAVASTASRRARPRDSTARVRCSAAVSSRRSRSARSGEMSEAHCRWVAASPRWPRAASRGAELLQLGGQALVGLVQGGHPVLPGHRLADQVGGPGVQQAAPADRDAGVDRVPDQQVADRHRAGGFFRPPLHQAGRHGRLDRRGGRGHLCGLAQLGQRHALVQHRQHLQNDPALGRQRPEVITDGGGQRPGYRGPSGRVRIEAGALAEQRSQVERVPAGLAVKPPGRLLIQRFGPQRGGQRRDLRRVQPAQREEQPVLHAQQQPLGGLVQAVAGPAVGHHGDDRVHRQPAQHEHQRLHRLPVGPLQVIDHDGQHASLLFSHHLQQPGAHGKR